jgi:hypothetical protein
MGETYYSDGRVERSNPDPAAKMQAAGFLALQRRNPPQVSTDNRLSQSRHFHGVSYIAIKARMDLAGSCTYELLKRRKPNRNKSTFGPGGTVAKAVSSAQQSGRDEDYTPFDDLDFAPARLMANPNPNETAGELAAKLILQNCLTGVGPVWAVPNSQGRPVEIWCLRTPLMFPLPWSERYPNGAWRINPQIAGGWYSSMPYMLGAAGAILPGEEVKRFLEPSPLWDGDGYSPLTAGAVELDVLRSIDESRKSAMDNGLQLDAVLIAPGMDKDSCQQFADKMTDRHGGSKNAKKFGVIAPPSGMNDKATLQTFGASAKDMDYQGGWEQYVKFVLALFGVPASVAGLSQTSSYSELYAALRQFHSRQSQYIGRLESWYTRTVAEPWQSYPGEYLVRIKLPHLDDPDMRERQFTRQLQNNLLTYNQALAKDDLPPVEGGDVPVSIYLKLQEQKLAPQQPPQMPGNAPDAPGEGKAGKGPTAGAVPKPENKAAEGTGLPTVTKAEPCGMGEAVGSAGGFLVPPDRKQVKRRVRRIVRKALEGID